MRIPRTAHDHTMKIDPFLHIGDDAICGNTHVQGVVMSPHHFGLVVTRDTDSAKEDNEAIFC